MKEFNFSQESKIQLETCHHLLQQVATQAIQLGVIDFKVFEGYRSPERQHKLFLDGKSKIDGYTKKGKHNYSPSLAFDAIPCFIKKGKNVFGWDVSNGLVMVGVMLSAWSLLQRTNNECRGYVIRSGADWNRNRTYVTDQSFDDIWHIELVKIQQQ